MNGLVLSTNAIATGSGFSTRPSETKSQPTPGIVSLLTVKQSIANRHVGNHRPHAHSDGSRCPVPDATHTSPETIAGGAGAVVLAEKWLAGSSLRPRSPLALVGHHGSSQTCELERHREYGRCGEERGKTAARAYKAVPHVARCRLALRGHCRSSRLCERLRNST